MLILTPTAIAKVKAVMSERGEEGGLRIAVVGAGCSGFQYEMFLDREAAEGDRVIELDGLRVFVDARSMLYLNGASIDYVEGPSGSGFKFDNPNALKTCSCGESFNA